MKYVFEIAENFYKNIHNENFGYLFRVSLKRSLELV